MSEHKAIVTGGAGFIGSHLVDALLAADFTVVVIDSLVGGHAQNLVKAHETKRLSVLKEDVRSPGVREIISQERPEVVLHLASQIDVRTSVDDPVFDAEVNVLGALNVLEGARAAGTRRVVVASSGGSAYGDGGTPPLDEAAPGRPVSPYGISKRVIHDYLGFYHREHGLESVALAMANVFGPRQGVLTEAGVVAVFLKAMVEGRPTEIFGDGLQTRDFVYVDDAVAAFLLALDKGGGVYNIGTGIETSVLDLWGLCAEVTGFKGEPSFAPARQGEIVRSALNSTKASRELGWVPRTTLKKGLASTAASFKAPARQP